MLISYAECHASSAAAMQRSQNKLPLSTTGLLVSCPSFIKKTPGGNGRQNIMLHREFHGRAGEN